MKRRREKRGGKEYSLQFDFILLTFYSLLEHSTMERGGTRAGEGESERVRLSERERMTKGPKCVHVSI